MGKFFSTGVEVASATTIRITFTYRGIRCRESLNLQPTPANLKRAANHRAVVLAAIEKGLFDYAVTFPNSPRAGQFAQQTAKMQTLEAYLTTWLARRKTDLKASTWEGYRKILNQIIPVFGAAPLDELKRPILREWFEKSDASNKTCANVQSVLRAALQDAVMDDILAINPLHGWKFARRNPPRKDHVDPFTKDEQTAIMRGLPEQGVNLFQFAFWTGLRTSELVALDWGDIDWLRGVVRVSRALTQAATEPEEPKTKSGNRDVKLLPMASEALTQQKKHTLLMGKAVFHNPRTNLRWEGDQAIRHTLWIPALRKAGVRYRNPYQTRHTYGSMMLTAGESPMWVAQQMGHSDWSMIARVYGKWIADAQPDAGMKAAGLFSDLKGE